MTKGLKIAVLIVAFGVTGCGGGLISGGDGSIKDELGEVTRCIQLASARDKELDAQADKPAKDRQPVIEDIVSGSIDVMLACYLGPDRETPKDDERTKDNCGLKEDGSPASEYDRLRCVAKGMGDDMRLLRGHIVVALLSRYAALNHTGDIDGILNIKFRRSSDSQEDARQTLAAIAAAEYELRRAASAVFKVSEDETTGELRQLKVPNYDKDHFDMKEVQKVYELAFKMIRVRAVADVARVAAEPTAKRAAFVVRTAVRAILARSVTDAKAVLKGIRDGVTKYAVLNQFGPPYLTDARNYLQTKKGETVAKVHWQFWDRYLEGACSKLAGEAGARVDCTPGNYKP